MAFSSKPRPSPLLRRRPLLHHGSLLRHGSLLSLLTLLSRVTGLIREISKAALMGTSALSDAFSVAFLIPNLFRRLFAEGSISVAFIPVFKSCLMNDADKETGSRSGGSVREGAAREFFACFLSFLSFIVSVAVGAGLLATPYLVRLFGSDAYDETVLLTRVMFPFLGFVSIAALFQGVLNSVNVFTPSGFAPVLLNLSTIACAWALKDLCGNPARAMAVGVLVGGLLEAAVQIPFVYKNGFRLSFTGLRRAFCNPNTRTVLRLIVPTIVGMAAYQLNDLVSSALARNAGEGVLSSLQYSLRLQELILGVFAVSIGTVLLPSLAEAAQKEDWARYHESLSTSVNIISLITIPVTFFSLVCGEDIIRILFQVKNFDEPSVQLTLSAFRFHIAGLFFIALNRILAPAFYARKDTASPTGAGIVSFVANIALAVLLVRPLRGSGIALALSVAGAINSAALLVMLRKRSIAKSALSVRQAPALYLLKIGILTALAIAPVLLARRTGLYTLPSRLGLPPRLALITSTVFLGVIFCLTLVLLLALSRDRYVNILTRKLRPHLRPQSAPADAASSTQK